MKVNENKQRNEKIGFALCWVVLLVGLALLVCALNAGCAGTVAPDRVEARQASFDGNEQNSGVIMSTPSGFVVTSYFRQRYNALIATYGGDFKPALKPDDGIAPIGEDRWLISKQRMIDFLEMNAWRRAGLQPKGNP
jgi:F0F1-type ATP synthase membrane subunit c/vacuolar-type H+-ATPase subunit K